MDSRPRTCFIHMDAGQISTSLAVAPPYLGKHPKYQLRACPTWFILLDSQSQRGFQAPGYKQPGCDPYCRQEVCT
jgi:hypothetical protein